jgi:hypothetical protein
VFWINRPIWFRLQFQLALGFPTNGLGSQTVTLETVLACSCFSSFSFFRLRRFNIIQPIYKYGKLIILSCKIWAPKLIISKLRAAHSPVVIKRGPVDSSLVSFTFTVTCAATPGNSFMRGSLMLKVNREGTGLTIA